MKTGIVVGIITGPIVLLTVINLHNGFIEKMDLATTFISVLIIRGISCEFLLGVSNMNFYIVAKASIKRFDEILRMFSIWSDAKDCKFV